MNQFTCIAVINERDALRYTPAGIPIVSARLQHGSEQNEAGIRRRVELELNTVVAGELSDRFCKTPIGTLCRFSGFLARRNRNSKSLVFHVTDFDIDTSDTGAQDGIR